MLFWHVGATIAFVRYAFRDEAMDLRFLALGAILPDLIDTPLGIAMWDRFGAVRLWSHSFLAAAIVMVAVLVATSRGPSRKRWMLLATGILIHLVTDAMWNAPETMWWPFLGRDLTTTGFATFGAYLGDVLGDPVMWVGEVVGIAYLLGLWRKAGLEDVAARRDLIERGTVSAPIG